MKTKSKFLIIITLIFVTINVYLFVTAPVPLNQKGKIENYNYSVEEAFRVIAKLNDVTRTFYTKNIVGQGKDHGFEFDEDWKAKDVEAGPLPALFLRETAAFIEKTPVGLGLYLGSDYPISQANLFSGVQAKKFQELKQDAQPRFFFDKNTNRNIGMFPDFASANACVKCHNDHKDSPKKNWVLNDIMGATTWSYAQDSLTTRELLNWIQSYKDGAIATYAKYLKEVNSFASNPVPEIGSKWPNQGYFMPDKENFEDTISKLLSYEISKSFIK